MKRAPRRNNFTREGAFTTATGRAPLTLTTVSTFPFPDGHPGSRRAPRVRDTRSRSSPHPSSPGARRPTVGPAPPRNLRGDKRTLVLLSLVGLALACALGLVSYSTNHRVVCPSSDRLLVTTSTRIGQSSVAASAWMTLSRISRRTLPSPVSAGSSTDMSPVRRRPVGHEIDGPLRVLRAAIITAQLRMEPPLESARAAAEDRFYKMVDRWRRCQCAVTSGRTEPRPGRPCVSPRGRGRGERFEPKPADGASIAPIRGARPSRVRG